MRSLVVAITLFVSFAAPLAAHAKCAGYYENLLTPLVVAGTPTLVLEVGGFDSDTASEVVTTLELRAANGKAIPIELRATHRGMNQRQLVVVPKAPLAPGRYTFRRNVGDERRHERHELVVIAASEAHTRWPDTCSQGCAPIAASITSTASQREEFGCGPAESIEVELGNSESWLRGATWESPRLALVALTDGATHVTQSGYATIAAREGGALVVEIGHGMCSGAFVVAHDAHYHATITLVGPDGSLGPASALDVAYQPSK